MKQIPNSVQWISYTTHNIMTDAEKEKHPDAEVTGGYLRKQDNSESNNAWWRRLSNREKEIIKAIPNFDKKIFKEITGIDMVKNGHLRTKIDKILQKWTFMDKNRHLKTRRTSNENRHKEDKH